MDVQKVFLSPLGKVEHKHKGQNFRVEISKLNKTTKNKGKL